MTHLPIWFLCQFDVAACDDLIKQAQAFPDREATIGEEGKQLDTVTRNTKVRFAPPDFWLAEVLKHAAYDANEKCGWNYELSGQENIQFAEYGPGQHYHWHTDTFTLSGKPQDRKITVVCLLSDPATFEGGEFQVRLYQDYVAPLQKGSMIVFPSILEHRVTPVLSGVRHTATMWFSGPRFR